MGKVNASYLLAITVILAASISCICSKQPVSSSKRFVLDSSRKTSLFRILRRTKRNYRNVERFFSNVCKEKAIEVDLQKHFGSTDIFNPPTIVKYRCVKETDSFGRKLLQTCGGPLHGFCVTRKRTIHFTRQPKGKDCRHLSHEKMTVGVACECKRRRKGIFS